MKVTPLMLAGGAALAYGAYRALFANTTPPPGASVPSGSSPLLPDPGASSSFVPPASGSGRNFLLSLGEPTIDRRDSEIEQAVDAGFFVPLQWQAVSYEDPDHGTVTIWCATDALMVGETDPVRVNVRHATAQRIADRLGCVLPTSLMSDAAWMAAEATGAALGVHNLPADAKMSSTARMIEHSDLVWQDRRKKGVPDDALARDAGKDWVNTERLIAKDGSWALNTGTTGEARTQACANFGWHMRGAGSESPGKLPVIQSIGLAHGAKHVDYSQVVTLYRKDCLVGGRERLVIEVLSDPELAYLLSDEVARGQAARCLRFPGAPLSNV